MGPYHEDYPSVFRRLSHYILPVILIVVATAVFIALLNKYILPSKTTSPAGDGKNALPFGLQGGEGTNAAPAVPTSKAEIAAILRRAGSLLLSVSSYSELDDFLKRGSGFFISSNKVFVANRRIMKNADYCEVLYGEGRYKVDTFLDSSIDMDLIVMQLPDSNIRYDTPGLQTTVPKVGDPVFLVYAQETGERNVFPSVVLSRFNLPPFGDVLGISASIPPERSVSPVANLSGDIVGIGMVEVINGKECSFVLPVDYLFTLNQSKHRPLKFLGDVYTPEELQKIKNPFDQAVYLFQKREYEKAASYFEVIAGENSRNAELFLFLGSCYQQLNKPSEQVVKALKTALSINPKMFQAHFLLGKEYKKLNMYEESITEFNETIRLNPSHFEAMQILGINAFENKKYEKCINYMEKVKALKGGMPIIDLYIGLSYSALSEDMEAIRVFQTMLIEYPHSLESYVGIGYIALKVRNFDLGKKHLKEGLIEYLNDPVLLVLLGSMYLFNDEEVAVEMIENRLAKTDWTNSDEYGRDMLVNIKKAFNMAVSSTKTYKTSLRGGNRYTRLTNTPVDFNNYVYTIWLNIVQYKKIMQLPTQ